MPGRCLLLRIYAFGQRPQAIDTKLCRVVFDAAFRERLIGMCSMCFFFRVYVRCACAGS